MEDAIARGGAGTQVVGQAFIVDATRYGYHAVLWSGSPASGYSLIDLAPAGADWMSDAIGTTGTQQVGNAEFNNVNHAGLWHGTAASWVDLNPTGAASSNLVGFSDTQQVGSATFSNATHAGRWNGTAGSWVDLNPAGATGSVANAVAGTQQVGQATFANGKHAGLWNGTAASWVDLNPAGATESDAQFTSGTQELGYAKFGSNNHAGLWNGTATSWVDLNPAGATSSQVNGTSGTQQVGQATFGSVTHAGLWNGTASSWVDLNPSGATTSVVDAVYGTTQVGYAKFSDGETCPVLAAAPPPRGSPLRSPTTRTAATGTKGALPNLQASGPTVHISTLPGTPLAGNTSPPCNTRTQSSGRTRSLVDFSGDYNGDGMVDAADYSVWRDHLGQTFALPNRGTANTGPISAADYDVWKSNFGNHAGSGAGAAVGAPEPTSVTILLIGVAILWGRRQWPDRS